MKICGTVTRRRRRLTISSRFEGIDPIYERPRSHALFFKKASAARAQEQHHIRSK